jgi:hypothetical protein
MSSVRVMMHVLHQWGLGASVGNPRRAIQKELLLPHTNMFSFEPYAVG